MSCHTWVYKKVSALTDAEKTECVNKYLKDARNWWGFKCTLEDITERVKKWYKRQPEVFNEKIHGTPEQYAKNLLAEYTKKLNDIQIGGFNAIIQRYKDFYASFIKYNGEIYYNIGVDTVFRSYQYTNINFTDSEKLIDWLKQQNSDKIGYYNNNNFIKGYSNILETRIIDFFNVHGTNNICIQIG